jgi:hypothetical protein
MKHIQIDRGLLIYSILFVYLIFPNLAMPFFPPRQGYTKAEMFMLTELSFRAEAFSVYWMNTVIKST